MQQKFIKQGNEKDEMIFKKSDGDLLAAHVSLLGAMKLSLFVFCFISLSFCFSAQSPHHYFILNIPATTLLSHCISSLLLCEPSLNAYAQRRETHH